MKEFNHKTTKSFNLDIYNSPFVIIYNKRKHKYANYAKKIEYYLHRDENEANVFSEITCSVFTHFIENCDIEAAISSKNYDKQQIKHILTVYFIACFWIIHKYCHDEYVSGKYLCNITHINIKDLCRAEVNLLFLYEFNIREWMYL